MSWKLTTNPKTVKITRKLAQEFADMDPAPHDRPLSERRLTAYRKIIQGGGFRPISWASASCTETGGKYRVNGKHTSTLLANWDGEFPELHAVLEQYHCDTLEDVAKLYGTFDSKMQSRTASDINMSFAATIPPLADVSRRVVNLATSGMSYHIWQEGYTSKQPAERAETLLEQPDFVLWLATLVGDAGGRTDGEPRSSKHVMRYPVVAAMFGTWLKAQGPATVFWNAVRDETGANPNLPDRKLARYLLTVNVDNGAGASRARRASPREFYVKSLHSWNAWRRGETTNLNYYADAKVPAVH